VEAWGFSPSINGTIISWALAPEFLRMPRTADVVR
jgi:hypothetical protein